MDIIVDKKNINWVNLIKGLCIIFVFFRHVEVNYDLFLGETADGIISTFYVNAFFFVSGYLLFRKQLSQPMIGEPLSFYLRSQGGGYKLANNILFRIIIPSVIFATIEFIPSCIIQGREIMIDFLLY